MLYKRNSFIKITINLQYNCCIKIWLNKLPYKEMMLKYTSLHVFLSWYECIKVDKKVDKKG
ncbi:MAG: hypothetical protein ACKESC_00275 [Candidatus Hodgkinia cicadicola]